MKLTEIDESTGVVDGLPDSMKKYKFRDYSSNERMVVALDDPEMAKLGIFGPNSRMNDHTPTYATKKYVEKTDNGIIQGVCHVKFSNGWPQMPQKRVMDALMTYCDDRTDKMDENGIYFLNVREFIQNYLLKDVNSGNIKQLYKDLVVLAGVEFSKDTEEVEFNKFRSTLEYKGIKLFNSEGFRISMTKYEDENISVEDKIPFYIHSFFRKRLANNFMTPTDMRFRNKIIASVRSSRNNQTFAEAIFLYLSRMRDYDLRAFQNDPKNKIRSVIVIRQEHLLECISYDIDIDENEYKKLSKAIGKDKIDKEMNKDKRQKIRLAKVRLKETLPDLIALSIIRVPLEGEDILMEEFMEGRCINVTYRLYFGAIWDNSGLDSERGSKLTSDQRDAGKEFVKALAPDLKIKISNELGEFLNNGKTIHEIVDNLNNESKIELRTKKKEKTGEWNGEWNIKIWEPGQFSYQRLIRVLSWYKSRRDVLEAKNNDLPEIGFGVLVNAIKLGDQDNVIDIELEKIKKIMSDHEDRKKEEQKIEEKKKEDKKIEEERINNLMMEAKIKRTTLNEFEKIVLKHVKYEFLDLERVKKINDELKKRKWFSEGDIVVIPVGNMLHYYSCHDRSLLSDVILTGNWRPLEEKCLKLDIISSRSKLSKDEQNAIKKHNGSIMNKMSSSNLVLDRDFIFAKFENESEIYIVANKDVGDIGDRLKKISIDEALEKIKI